MAGQAAPMTRELPRHELGAERIGRFDHQLRSNAPALRQLSAAWLD